MKPKALINTLEMEDRPDVPHIVDGVLEEKAQAMLHGLPATGKSFIAIDLAYCIATGLPWQGHPVKQGSVVYVAAEGQSTFPKRVKSWRVGRGIEQKTHLDVWYYDSAIDPLDEVAISHLIKLIKAVVPSVVLVIFDTWAKCLSMGNANENDSNDMGKAWKSLDRIVAETNAAVLLLHHQGHTHGRPRGSSIFKANIDTEFALVQTSSGIMKLTNLKQKNSPVFDDIKLKLEPEPTFKAAFLVLVDGTIPAESADNLNPTQRAVLDALIAEVTEYTLTKEGEECDGVQLNTWSQRAGYDPKNSTFKGIKTFLIKEGYVDRIGEGKGVLFLPMLRTEALVANEEDECPTSETTNDEAPCEKPPVPPTPGSSTTS